MDRILLRSGGAVPEAFLRILPFSAEARSYSASDVPNGNPPEHVKEHGAQARNEVIPNLDVTVSVLSPGAGRSSSCASVEAGFRPMVLCDSQVHAFVSRFPSNTAPSNNSKVVWTSWTRSQRMFSAVAGDIPEPRPSSEEDMGELRYTKREGRPVIALCLATWGRSRA